MKAVVCRAFGPPESLTLEDVPVPRSPGPGDVRIAVRAAGLNFPDVLMVAGKYQVKPPFPFSPGMECAGVVTEVGAGVDAVRVGERVMAVPGHGAMAEEVVASAAQTFRIPDAMSFEQAAAFPIVYGTVRYAFSDRAPVRAGDVVLITGAAGGVGLAAVGVAKILGATVIAAASSDEKLALARDHGADEAINYAKEDLRDRVRALTEDHGADVIFDPVGGDVFDAALRSIAFEGRLVVIGFASGRIPAIPANVVLLRNCTIVGVYWGGFAERDPARNRAHFAALLRWFDEGRLRAPVTEAFALAEVASAMNALVERRATGKLVVTVKCEGGAR